MSGVVNINDVLDGDVQLDVECLDRIYLNGYVPSLHVGGQVVRVLTGHLGNPIPSPAILERIGQRFRSAVERFAARNRIPVVRFKKGERGIDRMRPFYSRARRPGVVAVGVAQEFQWIEAEIADRLGRRQLDRLKAATTTIAAMYPPASPDHERRHDGSS